MTANNNQSLFADSFPNIIKGFEIYLGLNPKGLNDEQYIMLGENETPYSRLKDGENNINELFNSNSLTMEDTAQINQMIAHLTLRLSYTVLYAKSTGTAILLPNKDNYYGLGVERFLDIFESMVRISNLSNKSFNSAIITQLTGIVKNPYYLGKHLTFELRIINIMIMLLNVINNVVTVSFLAQLLLQQHELSKH